MYCFLFFVLFQATFSYKKVIHEWDSGIINELFKTSKVSHPCTVINKEDLERAKKNIEKYSWAAKIKNNIVNDANYVIGQFKDDAYLDKMIPKTTPATETFCPNCAKKGGFHSKGAWSWNRNNPDVIYCSKCKMTFPNSQYPESIQFQSTFDPEQTISYVNTGPQTCMKYFRCFSSIEGLIRGKKIEYTIRRIPCVAQAYALTGDIKYAEAAKRFLMKFADRMPRYMVYCAYSYNQYADCDPHYVVQNLPYLPEIKNKQCPMIVADPENAGNSFFSGYWSASRLGTSGTDGEYVEVFAEAYDLIADAVKPDGKPLLTDKEREHIEKDLLIESALLGYFNDKVDNKQTMNMKGCSLVGLAVGNPKLVRFGLNGFLKTLDDYFLKDGSSSQSQGYGLKAINGLIGFNLAFRNYTDPPDFVPGPDEVAFKNFNINRDTTFEAVWHSYMWVINPDNTFPIIGDQTFKHRFPGSYTEYLAAEYPHEYMLQYLGYSQTANSPNEDALYLRDPDYVPYPNKTKLPDMVYPYLQQGFIRSGDMNEKSILVLDASSSDGGHHHLDSLNIVYNKYNLEMLLDLGYLTDHPNGSYTQATVAHQTVLIDGVDQMKEKRGGQMELFDTSFDDTKVMQASSRPYSSAKVYQRTLLQIKHEKNDYLVDIFRSNGGRKRRELVIHGPNNNYKMSKDLTFDQPYEIVPAPSSIQFRVRYDMTLDIGDFLMQEAFESGSPGAQILHDIVPIEKCTNKSEFCYSKKKGDVTFELIDGPTKGKKAIRFHASNADLLVGHSLFYLPLKENARYNLQFQCRGTGFPEKVRLQYNGKEAEFKKTSLNQIKKDEWTLFTGYFDLEKPFTEAMGTTSDDSLKVEWKMNNDVNFSIFAPARKGQKIFFKNGWGQRHTDNSDFGATLPYFYFYREKTENISTWVTIYEGYKEGESVVEGFECQDDGYGNVAIKVKTVDGYDYVSSSFNGEPVINPYGLNTDALVAVINNGNPRLFDGNYLEFNGKRIESDLNKRFGSVVDNGISDKFDKSWYDIDGNVDIKSIKEGQVLFVNGSDGVRRGYPILSAEKVGDKNRVYVKIDYRGFRSYPAENYHIMSAESDYFSVPSGDSSKKKKKGLSGGAVAAIVIVVLVVVAAAVVGVLYYLKKNNKLNVPSLLSSSFI